MNKILECLENAKLVPVVKINHVEDAIPLAKALCEGGLNIVEITFRTNCAKEAIKCMTQAFPDMLVGAGTILTTNQVDEAIESGASFIVAPGFNEKVVSYCIKKNIPIFPGCSHASDIERAIEHGLKVVKFFPAKELGGIKTIKALAAPYSQIKFMPTGGITEDTLLEYLACEPIIACGGSWMVKEALIEKKAFDEIKKLTQKAVSRIHGGSVVQKVGDVATFGEMLLRLSAPDHLRLTQADQFRVHYGGAEANVAVSLAQFGLDVRFITKLPSHELGQNGVNELRKYGVETKYITRGGERVGLYFLEKGASQRPSKVLYDRAYSAMSQANKEDFDWDQLLEGVKHFFVTGITPALGENVAELCLLACKKCKEKQITVWCDLNYREKLWSKDKASKVLQEMMQYVDCCITNEHHAVDMLGVSYIEGQSEKERLEYLAKEMTRKFDFQLVALTMRKSISASNNILSAMLYTEDKSYFAKSYDMHIIDRVGGGDAFAAGLIYAIEKGYTKEAAIEFATAKECLKHTIEGDFNQVSVQEVLNLMNGNGQGLVQR